MSTDTLRPLAAPPHITTKITRPDAEALARLGRFGSASIHEAQGRRGDVSSVIKPIDNAMRFAGSAFTVVCAPRDNLMLQVAIHYAQPGDVLLVSAGEMGQAGTFGDVLGNAAKAKGIAAVVTDSGVRDTQSLRALGLPVFSGSVAITGTVKNSLGRVNQPLVFGDQLIHPGDAVVGDADGIVVVRRDEVDTVAELSRRREEHEDELIELYKAGRTTIDLCGLHDVLREKGLTTDIDDVDPDHGLGAKP
ncbi:4-carboxy-4-hydroxy-2-oxoadipate aldolase/oxaloacetate decarboxylase [Microbacterium halophytorum]|uniref:4-carboxy-4-hydroxy-2-oxoadipate aldolase/oxaloacetate decarboxylase n=1 Tax=Microbacterium halophytorum TaxID=2067568 RepID=UPI000CFBA1DC|nr:4-carboxy-4-hydroxy-2-oxoadipate aldolase/oxaloacetate decarboxylase [Microbacterium halophytorum]